MKKQKEEEKKQILYNKDNKIKPKGVSKSIPDIMEADTHEKNEKKYINDDFLKEYTSVSPSIVMKKIKKLEEKMYEHASNLEFEEASRLRDEITKIKDFVFSNSSQETGS